MKDTLTPFLWEAESPSTGRVRRSVFVGLFVALVALALVVPPAAVGDSAAADEWPWEVEPGPDSDLFPLVADLTFRDADGDPVIGTPEYVGIDPEVELAIFLVDGAIRLVDTRTLEVLDIIELPEGYDLNTTRQAVIDTENHRLFLPAAVAGPAPGQEDVDWCLGLVVVACDLIRPTQPAIVTVSLMGEHAPVGTPLVVDVDDAAEDLVTEIVQKLGYHSPTDRLYVLTESGPTTDQTGNRFTTLHEFRADDLVGSASAPAETVWSYQLDLCTRASNPSKGGFLARSLRADFIYLPCEGGGAKTLGTVVDINMHGALRIDLRPGTDPSDTSQFESRFSPFAADLSAGYAMGDAKNDLIFFVASSASRQRLFVFDAFHEAWTGASALLGGPNFQQLATNPATGRIFVPAVESGLIRVTEGRRIAVPNGTDYDLGIVKLPLSLAGFDPSTRRLFLMSPQMCLARADDGSCSEPEDRNTLPHFRVFEERLADAPPPEPEDYDRYTEDVSNADGEVYSSAGANAKAFGARYLMVGGLESSRPLNLHTTTTNEANRREMRTVPVGLATRDVIRAHVREASLSRVTGTPTVVASGAGLTLGDQTKSDVKRNTERSWPEDVPPEMRGHEASCNDFGGERTDDAKPGAAVACDSLQPVGQAAALYTATDEQNPVQVGYAETSVDVREDDSSGAVATATAVARDIHLFGQISIGEIRTEATAVAHGRQGTAATELTREYRQVRIGDEFRCGWGDDDPCDLWEVADAINEVMRFRLVASVPAQDTTLDPDASDEPDNRPGKARVSNGTPGGARAVVTLDPYDAQSNLTINQDQRTELPGLQIVYYDDHEEASRHIFQFAAVNLDVFYYISSAPTFDPPDWADGGGGDDGSGPDGGLPDGLGGAAARTITPPPIVALGEEPVVPAEEPEFDTDEPVAPINDANDPEFESETRTSAPQQGQAPGLGTADGPALGTGKDVPTPEVAPDATAGQETVAAAPSGEGGSGPGGLMLTRQRMGETVPLAVLWVMAALPFYLAVRRRRLLTSSTR